MKLKKIGNWHIGDMIKRGGQARIFEVSRDEGSQICALKIISSPYPKKRDRFVQEISKHVELSERKAKNIIPIIEHNLDEFVSGGLDGYIVMPRAETNLEDEIVLLKGRTELCLEIFRGIVHGIKEAHSIGVVHRDIKPSNILFTDRSLREPLISDFGICFLKDTPLDERITNVYETVGAKFFMAPEQERGGLAPIAETADIYALGKLLHYMITGRTLFRENVDEAFEEKELNEDPRLRIIFERIIQKSIVLEPEQRIQTADELLKIVDELIGTSGGSKDITGQPSSSPLSPTEFNETQTPKISESYKDGLNALKEGKTDDLKLKFDDMKRTFKDEWVKIFSSIESEPQRAPEAALNLIKAQPETTGLILAIVRLDAKELFRDFKGLLEFITRSSEGKAGYVAVHAVPHVQAGFLYMSACIAALDFESWSILRLLLNTKFEWYYHSGSPLYAFGFNHPYFFHADALGRSAIKCHDLYRAELADAHILDILGLDEEHLLDTYCQTQMIMCLRGAQEVEKGNEMRIWADFGRFYGNRVIKLLEKAYHDTTYAEGLCGLFNEKREEWFDKLNGRLKIARGWFKGAPYFWESIDSFEPQQQF